MSEESDYATNEAYLAVDDEWRLTRSNAAAARLLDRPAAELSGSRLWEAFPEIEGTPFAEALRRAMADSEAVSREAPLPDRDAWFELRAYPDDGGLSMYLRDVTDRRERTRALEATRARFSALTSNTDQVVLTIDDDSVVRYANEATEAVFGYAPDELVGRSLLTLVPERFHDAHEAAIDRYLETGERSLEWDWIELPGLHRDGHEVPLGISFGEAEVGGAHRFTATVRDISDRKRRERRREATLESLRELYDVTTDPELAFEEKIDRTLELGCERLELPYGFLSRVDTDETGDGRQTIVHACGDHPLLQSEESCPLSEAYCRRAIETDGLLAIQDAVAAGFEDDPAYRTFELGAYIGGKVVVDGDLYGTLCFAATEPREEPFSDAARMLVRVTSKWMSYELERTQRTAELKRTNERLEEFASVVSHDLRNPLTVADGHLELAREEADSEDLAAVAEALERMEALVDDLLALARDGESAAEIEAVDLARVSTDCFETVETADAELVVGETSALRADAGRLKQLLENLFRNAVEHAGEDVTITVGDLDRGFYVEDDGPGIPADDGEAVFESGFTTAESGTGFGLAIVEEIATAHGWSVTATESDDGGARFEITGVERP
jgi:PAS domain S-box-containing protein